MGTALSFIVSILVWAGAIYLLIRLIIRHRRKKSLRKSSFETVEYIRQEEPYGSQFDEVGIGQTNITISIMYGDPSEPRTVTIHRLTARDDGVIYLRCYCHKRQAPRTFRADRIKYFFDEAGEITETREFLTETLKIPLWARSIRARKDKRPVDRLNPC